MRERKGFNVEGREKINIDAYLRRIGLDRAAVSTDIDSLRLLQRSHLLAVPFENLDIHWKRPIVLDVNRFYEKIVEQRRGGFCYELNGLFRELLQELGFETRLISARVFNGKLHGPEFDHAAIIVTTRDCEYLADVGYGDFTAEPLRFALDEVQTDAAGTFIIRRYENEYFEVARKVEGAWRSEYIFADIPRELSEFAEMCEFQQYSLDSHFTKGRLCSIMTENGRRTLTDAKFIVTSKGEKTEIAVGMDFDWILQNEFSIMPSLT